MYALTFGTGEYFADRGIPTFHPLVTVTFTVEDDAPAPARAAAAQPVRLFDLPRELDHD